MLPNIRALSAEMFSQLEAILLQESGYILYEGANDFLILFSPNLTEVTFPLAGTTECLHKSRRVKAVLFHPVKRCLPYQPPGCLTDSKPDENPSTGAHLCFTCRCQALQQTEGAIFLCTLYTSAISYRFASYKYSSSSFMFTNFNVQISDHH